VVGWLVDTKSPGDQIAAGVEGEVVALDSWIDPFHEGKILEDLRKIDLAGKR
jgi:hypothetical protein